MIQGKALITLLSEVERETIVAMDTIMQKHGLPCFLFEPIVYKVYRQVADGKAAELAAAKNRSNVKEEVYADN